MSVSQLLKYRYTSVFFSVYCVNCLWQLSLCGYTPLFYPYSWSRKSVFPLLWDRYSSIPRVPPWGPPPGSARSLLNKPFHFTLICRFWKKLRRIGIIDALTPLSIKDWIPSLCDCLSKACFQSTKYHCHGLFH